MSGKTKAEQLTTVDIRTDNLRKVTRALNQTLVKRKAN